MGRRRGVEGLELEPTLIRIERLLRRDDLAYEVAQPDHNAAVVEDSCGRNVRVRDRADGEKERGCQSHRAG